MICATVTGRLTKDAELRQAGEGSVCSLSIASNKKVKGENVATFVSASIWGKRGESLVQYLRKGTSVAAVGELSTREHDGKTYLELRVNEIDFMGGGDKKAEPKPAPRPAPDLGGRDSGDDSIPF
jgi:single-strand DNA-binding protein